MDKQLSKFLARQKRAVQTHPGAPAQLTKAAVLVLLLREKGEDHLLFTKRSQIVLHHKGQICFPGGACDEGDSDLWATAIRETREEIGLEPSLVSSVGRLGQLATPSGYLVTPFVGRVSQSFTLKPSLSEIAEIFTAPVGHFLNPENFRHVKKQLYGIEYEDPTFIYKNHEIWGATGRILVEFLEAWRVSYK
ncbi:MAG: CoA pyrophosphatase [Deltaproteobacteria bacterium]|nr:CoA pyrophosphatase [Deltaproteobacteria bacterium]